MKKPTVLFLSRLTPLLLLCLGLPAVTQQIPASPKETTQQQATQNDSRHVPVRTKNAPPAKEKPVGKMA